MLPLVIGYGTPRDANAVAFNLGIVFAELERNNRHSGDLPALAGAHGMTGTDDPREPVRALVGGDAMRRV
ncbi:MULTISPECIES: hypothetical protein [Methylobacteriaceae]|uniref:hypothetical protein n=1 Tax=Methylobacteriaceae TaxID=119045 RepID=UPI002F35D9C3